MPTTKNIIHMSMKDLYYFYSQVYLTTIIIGRFNFITYEKFCQEKKKKLLKT